MFRAALAAAALLASTGVLWLAGEQHRANCIDERKVECSVLPWDTGHYYQPGERVIPPSSEAPETEAQRLLREAAEREAG